MLSTIIVGALLLVGGFISARAADKRVTDLEEKIDIIQSRLEATLHHRAEDYSSLEELRQLTNTRLTNLENQSKNNYNHFTSRIDKLRNDALQNGRQY